MLKSALFAGAAMLSFPAFAQDAPQTQTTPPAQAETQAVTPQEAPATPTESTTAQTETQATGDVAAAEAAPAPAGQPAANSQPAAANGAQIAQVVNAEFANYDKNSNGDLDQNEFGAWMVALKTASDPSTKAEDPATKTWVGQAFASADADKSTAVSKEELTSFLSQGAE